jgi:hypothetical protein
MIQDKTNKRLAKAQKVARRVTNDALAVFLGFCY